METIEIMEIGVVTSRIGLGTWAIGGWMWGGTDEAESIRANFWSYFRIGAPLTVATIVLGVLLL